MKKLNLATTVLVFLALLLSCQKITAQSPGNALAFDGSSDFVYTVNSPTNVVNSTSTLNATKITIEVWVYWTPASATTVHFISGRYTENFEIHTAGGSGANGIRFIPVAGVYLDVENTLPFNTWTHLAMVYDPANATESERAKTYINGVRVAYIKRGTNPTSKALFSNSATRLNVGSRYSDVTQYHFKGKIDEFRLWNTARTDAQVLADMQNEVDPTTTGLVVYYNFNHGTAGGTNTGLNSLNNLVSDNFNGTLSSFALTGTTSNWVSSMPDKTLTLSSPAGTDAQTICANTTLTNITYATTNATGATFSGLPTGVTGSFTSNEVTISGTPTVAGAYTYTITLTGNAGFDNSTTGAITVNLYVTPTSGGTIAAAQSGSSPFDPAAFTSSAAASGHSGTLEYKWQSSTTSNITGFSDITEATSATYDAGSLTQTTWYKRLARVSCQSDWTGAAESNVIQATVYSSFSWNGSAGTDWNTAANWTPNFVPSTGATISIPSSLTNYPVTPSTVTIASLTVTSGGYTLGSSVVTLTGNLSNNGSITGTGKMVMGGSSDQTISGTGTISNLEVDNNAGVTISTGAGNIQSLAGELTLTSGTLATNGNLTLKSSSSGTARVAQHTTSGTISGNVTVERYIDVNSRPKQWRTMGFAYSGVVTLSTVTGFAVDYTSTSLSVMYYNEGGDDGRYGSGTGARNAGYVSVTGESVPIPAGRGVLAWIYGPTGTFGTAGPGTMSGDITASSSGELNETGSDVALPVAFSSGNTNRGWNLVSNPFASPIDWSHANITKTNIDNAIYRWDPASASWTVWSGGGASTPSGINANVESGGAFFVKANTAGPSLVIPQSAKTSSSSNFAHFSRAPGRPELPQERARIGDAVRLAGVRLSVSGAGNPLPNEAYLDLSRTDATGGFEGRYDAESMGRSSGAGVSIMDGQGMRYAIQFDAPIEETGKERRYYPVHVTSPTKGATTLELWTEGAWNPLNSVSLIDRKEGKTLLLQGGRLVYPFTMDELKSAHRFQLAINHVKVDGSGALPRFGVRLLGNPMGSERIDLLLTHPSAQPKSWSVMDNTGRTVGTGGFGEGKSGNLQHRVTVPGMRQPGVYILKVEMDNGDERSVQVVRN